MERTYSKNHIRRIERLVPLAASTKPLERLRKLREELDWGPRTMSTYLGTLKTAMGVFGKDTSGIEWRWITSELAKEVAAAPSWDYEDPTQILNNETIGILESMSQVAQGEARLVMTATLITLYLGQRMSDVLLLQFQNIVIMQDYYAVTFKEGKTVGARGAYTILVTRAGPIGQMIRQLPTSPTGRIFPANAETLLKAALHARNMKVDIRAVRRTGLIRLALAGATTDELLAASRHASLPMLNLYLSAGLFNLQTLRPLAAIADRAVGTGVPAIVRRSGATEAME
jgi:hypothetical protein